ncbi:histidine kinase [uncultured Aquimarina sp.]|uniref:sensor histidine kinase n=1 Tax=uncultured Aquimarina sp. TaxID=575652 RepID=UPI0026257FA6|nr:histidine kinase [uncultured Aquimarina sp.]
MNTNKPFIDRIIQNRKVSHLLFWGSFLLIFTLLASLNSGTLKSHIINYLAMLPSQIIAAYVLNYFQIPNLLLQKKYLLFLGSMIVSIYLLSAFARWSVVYIAEPFIRVDFVQESITEILSDFAYLFSTYFPAVYIYAFMMLIIKAIKDRFEEKHQLEMLLKEKATNELKFLKAQIQPHFLFNTLNNLYALTLSKSDVAPQVVLKLSELLDFILYQSDEASISIQKEIELIQGFIDLESLRYGDSLDLIFNHKADDLNTQIAPLLLLPLVENAFKHGSSGNPNNPKIHIDLSVIDTKLTFKVYNSRLHTINTIEKPNNKSGIGMSNLKRQLELNYANTYRLDIEDLPDSYSVELFIDLK